MLPFELFLRRGVAQVANLIVRGFHFRGLTHNDVFDRRGQFFLHRILVGGDGAVFAALRFREDGVAIAIRDRAFDVDPGAMHRPGRAARIFRIRIAEFHHFALQFTGKFRALERKLVEGRFQLGVIHAAGGLFEALLPVLQRFDQAVECADYFLVLAHIH